MSSLNMDETYGSLLIGAFFAIFLQGMLTVQAYIYYESFPTDSKKLKSLVAVIWVLDLAHLIFICHAVYHYLINSWGKDAALLQSTEDFDILVVLVGTVIVLCQGFFLRRIRTFSGNNWLAGLLALACLAILGLDTLIAVKLSINKSVTSFSSLGEATIILSSTGAGVDLLMAGILVWYLRKERQSLER
ncbi:hypothetical protein DFH08DRAFT_958967 [Mycena albidolilacea]|uniref:Uncharacterized protein n=1 Tax=Mycena albidolilacea TaxID=1033008 RepID=A0AAD7A5M6_9AGAR|nr:hypothetical protein DFH08DRAFT_958967 [Mycena albidolilacea]